MSIPVLDTWLTRDPYTGSRPVQSQEKCTDGFLERLLLLLPIFYDAQNQSRLCSRQGKEIRMSRTDRDATAPDAGVAARQQPLQLCGNIPTDHTGPQAVGLKG
jgi:hypothetical protein